MSRSRSASVSSGGASEYEPELTPARSNSPSRSPSRSRSRSPPSRSQSRSVTSPIRAGASAAESSPVEYKKYARLVSSLAARDAESLSSRLASVGVWSPAFPSLPASPVPVTITINDREVRWPLHPAEIGSTKLAPAIEECAERMVRRKGLVLKKVEVEDVEARKRSGRDPSNGKDKIDATDGGSVHSGEDDDGDERGSYGEHPTASIPDNVNGVDDDGSEKERVDNAAPCIGFPSARKPNEATHTDPFAQDMYLPPNFASLVTSRINATLAALVAFRPRVIDKRRSTMGYETVLAAAGLSLDRPVVERTSARLKEILGSGAQNEKDEDGIESEGEVEESVKDDPDIVFRHRLDLADEATGPPRLTPSEMRNELYAFPDLGLGRGDVPQPKRKRRSSGSRRLRKRRKNDEDGSDGEDGESEDRDDSEDKDDSDVVDEEDIEVVDLASESEAESVQEIEVMDIRSESDTDPEAGDSHTGTRGSAKRKGTKPGRKGKKATVTKAKAKAPAVSRAEKTSAGSNATPTETASPLASKRGTKRRRGSKASEGSGKAGKGKGKDKR